MTTLKRYQTEIARAARDRGSREAIAFAEEALVPGNEALEIAERPAAKLKAQVRVKRKKR